MNGYPNLSGSELVEAFCRDHDFFEEKFEELKNPFSAEDLPELVDRVMTIGNKLIGEVTTFLLEGRPRSCDEMRDFLFDRFTILHRTIYEINLGGAVAYLESSAEDEHDKFHPIVRNTEDVINHMHVVCTLRDDIVDMFWGETAANKPVPLYSAMSQLAIQNDYLNFLLCRLNDAFKDVFDTSTRKDERESTESRGQINYYRRDGVLHASTPLSEATLDGIMGMMVKCYMRDGTEMVGFADPYRVEIKEEYDGKIHDYINLWKWANLDESKHRLVGDDDTKYDTINTRVAIADILHIDAILYSHPRWGCGLTNRFFIDVPPFAKD